MVKEDSADAAGSEARGHRGSNAADSSAMQSLNNQQETPPFRFKR
ncbi:hypothetical protein PbJCM17693_40120 [Paenibacillus macerans]|nr:hypothetical protein PbJCM17693_40120 [Paenibacillus macerans]